MVASVEIFGTKLDETSKPDALFKALLAIVDEQKRLEKEGKDLRENIESKAADLRAINQALSEQKARQVEDSATQPEREMKKYLRPTAPGASATAGRPQRTHTRRDRSARARGRSGRLRAGAPRCRRRARTSACGCR